MKLKNVLIVVKDIEKARRFYHDLFGLEVLLDNDGNMILSEGLVLQEEKYWREFLGREIIPENNSSELYFEEPDLEGFVEKLESYYSRSQVCQQAYDSQLGTESHPFLRPGRDSRRSGNTDAMRQP